MSLHQNDESARRKIAAWQKAIIVGGYDPSIYRKDRFGLWIKWQEYGMTTNYGWEIDHIVPTSLGGLFVPSNEEATHWQNNRRKSNKFVG